MKRRGAIWVSAVLYIAVGTIVISILLASALPLVEKIKDRNSFVQAKELILVLDETIRTVATEGPGSQRELSPLTIKAGQIIISHDEDKVIWSMDTKAKLMEPNTVIKEGVLSLQLKTTPVSGKYLMTVETSYRNIYDITLNSRYQPPYTGTYTLIVKNTGVFTQQNRPTIELKVI